MTVTKENAATSCCNSGGGLTSPNPLNKDEGTGSTMMTDQVKTAEDQAQCPAWCIVTPEEHACDDAWFSHRSEPATLEDADMGTFGVSVMHLQFFTDDLDPGDATEETTVCVGDRLLQVDQAWDLASALMAALRDAATVHPVPRATSPVLTEEAK